MKERTLADFIRHALSCAYPEGKFSVQAVGDDITICWVDGASEPDIIDYVTKLRASWEHDTQTKSKQSLNFKRDITDLDI